MCTGSLLFSLSYRSIDPLTYIAKEELSHAEIRTLIDLYQLLLSAPSRNRIQFPHPFYRIVQTTLLYMCDVIPFAMPVITKNRGNLLNKSG